MALFFTKDNNIVNLPLKPPLILDLGEKDKHIYHSHALADAELMQETGWCGKYIGAMKGRWKCRNAEKLSEQWIFFFFLFFLVQWPNKQTKTNLEGRNSFYLDWNSYFGGTWTEVRKQWQKNICIDLESSVWPEQKDFQHLKKKKKSAFVMKKSMLFETKVSKNIA